MHAVMLCCHPDVRADRMSSHRIHSSPAFAVHAQKITNNFAQCCRHVTAICQPENSRTEPPNTRPKPFNTHTHTQPTSHQQPSVAIAGEKARQNRSATRAQSFDGGGCVGSEFRAKNFIRKITLE